MMRPLDDEFGGRRVCTAWLQHLYPRRRTAGPDRYRLQGRRQHRQWPSPDPGRPDPFCRGIDELPGGDGPRAARSPKCLPDHGQAAVRSARPSSRSNKVEHNCRWLGERPVRSASPAYMNVPSGSPLAGCPTVSKCASRDWICCDSVWMSRKRRSKVCRGRSPTCRRPCRRRRPRRVDRLAAAQPHAGAFGRADRLDVVGASQHSFRIRSARPAPNRAASRRATADWIRDCRRAAPYSAASCRGELMKASCIARAMPSATPATPPHRGSAW